MKHEIYKKDCPVLILTAITERGYILSANEDEAMVFESESEANAVSHAIPGTTSEFWGTRPRRKPRNI